jgi:hypothetical protein
MSYPVAAGGESEAWGTWQAALVLILVAADKERQDVRPSLPMRKGRSSTCFWFIFSSMPSLLAGLTCIMVPQTLGTGPVDRFRSYRSDLVPKNIGKPTLTEPSKLDLSVYRPVYQSVFSDLKTRTVAVFLTPACIGNWAWALGFGLWAALDCDLANWLLLGRIRVVTGSELDVSILTSSIGVVSCWNFFYFLTLFKVKF